MAMGMTIRGTTGGGGSAGGLVGARPRDYNPASGGVPGVTSPISTILGNLGGLGNITGAITGQQSAALRAQYPAEYFSTLGTLLGNAQRRASGDISDLLPELQTNAAERAVYGGVSGSAAENTKLLRDMGLTRYGVEQQALQDLGTIQREIPQVAPYDPTNLISSQLGAQQQADIMRAAPNPEAAYQRARRAAGGAVGGGGGGGAAFRPPGGGGVASVDDILRRYAAPVGYGPPIIAHGTRSGPVSDIIDEMGVPLWALDAERFNMGEPSNPSEIVGDDFGQGFSDELYSGYGPEEDDYYASGDELYY